MGSQTSRSKLTDGPPDIASANPKTLLDDTGSPQLDVGDRATQSPTKSTLLHKFGRAVGPLSPTAKSPNVRKKEKEKEDKEAETALSIRRRRQREVEESRPLLTEVQTEIVHRTWHILYQDLGEIGCDMFVRMFESYPSLKNAFGPFKSLNADDMRYNNVLRAHGQRLLSTIASVIEKRDDPDAMVRHLHELGQKHMTFDAKMAYMDVIAAQFLFAIEPVLGDAWTPPVEEAWAALFKLIMHVMREKMVF